MHEYNTFGTLTYNNANLPEGNTLVKSHFTKFIKRLRKHIAPKTFRYYMCGEYGKATEQNNYIARPHYHFLLFGYKFPDETLVNIREGNRVYTSKTLDAKWQHGKCELGSVTFQSAGYVARYLLKKQNGDIAKTHYAIINQHGEITGYREPEYTNMSLKPGIGKTWYDKNKMDLFPHDYAITPDFRKMPTPKYYRELLKKEDPDLYDELRKQRIEKAKTNPNTTPERLAVREICQQRKLDKLIRQL